MKKQLPLLLLSIALIPCTAPACGIWEYLQNFKIVSYFTLSEEDYQAKEYLETLFIHEPKEVIYDGSNITLKTGTRQKKERVCIKSVNHSAFLKALSRHLYDTACRISALKLNHFLPYVDSTLQETFLNDLSLYIRYSNRLTVLSLNDCGLDHHELDSLLDALYGECSLRELNLANNNIASIGTLARAVCSNRGLRKLNIQGNPILGVHALINPFLNHSKLTTLSIQRLASTHPRDQRAFKDQNEYLKIRVRNHPLPEGKNISI